MPETALPAWNAHYPDPQRLRHEANCMAESFAEVLLDAIPPDRIQGVYLKGSAQKPWDSPIDYVPEIGDVDVHIQFYADDASRHYLGTVPKAMEIQRQVEVRYRSKVDQPLHTPRPQLVVVNDFVRKQVFVHSPRSTARVLFGEEYPAADYSDPDSIRRTECSRLIEDAGYVGTLPSHVIDRPGKYLWESLRALVWRVSPTGPRVLHVLGVETEKAWSLNRTKIVPVLRELGQPVLADHYVQYYLSAWEYFLSGYQDNDAARSAITAASEALPIAAEIANGWLADHPETTETPPEGDSP